MNETDYKKNLIIEFANNISDSLIIERLKPFAISDIKRVSRSKNKWGIETYCPEMDCQNTIYQLSQLKGVINAGLETSMQKETKQQGMQKSKPINKKQ